ncbi:hypothetical protein HK104_006110 [Borealophlyctis nickersoniae]|nr:hypothetical protein HK104_006110 [Borealophlyctis nickersoniae]
MISRGNSVIQFVCYLDTFISTPLSPSFLSALDNLLNLVRQCGMKTILRFAYTQDQSHPTPDATKPLMKSHIASLAPLLQSHADVIALMHAGFIGVWGEWYYSKNFGRGDDMTPERSRDRGEILSEILAALPERRMVLVRTPGYKQRFFGRTAPCGDPHVTGGNAYSGVPEARIGFHNDCFLSDATDMGTFCDASDHNYVQSETHYVAMTGESCSAEHTSLYDYLNAHRRLSLEHWSLLNDAYHPKVLKHWKKTGCYDTIRDSLGYRFILIWAQFYRNGMTGVDARKDGYVLGGWKEVVLSNAGYASPFNKYFFEVLFVPTSMIKGSASSRAGYWARTEIDIRFFHGSTNNIIVPEHQFIVERTGLPDSPEEFELFINIRDAEPTLGHRPEYRILFANQTPNNGLWTRSRVNRMNYTVTLNPSLHLPPEVSMPSTAGNVVKLSSTLFTVDDQGYLSWKEAGAV